MKALQLILRQGDVSLWTISGQPPEKMVIRQREAGRVILARGESTGHHHSFGGSVELYEAEPGKPFKVKTPDGTLADALFVRVLETDTLEHQEHSPVEVSPGDYWVIMPREYTPQAIRRSTD